MSPTRQHTTRQNATHKNTTHQNATRQNAPCQHCQCHDSTPPPATVRPSRRRLRGRVTALLLTFGLVVTGSAASADPSPNPNDVFDGSLAYNGSFDVADKAGHPTRWTVEGNEAGANVVNLSAYRTSGLTSLEINDAAGTGVAVRSERVPAIPGVRYTASAKVKGKSGAPAWLYLEFWDIVRDGPRLYAVETRPVFATDWQDVQVSAVAPAGTVHVNMLVYGSQAAEGVSYWDEARLVAEPAPYDPQVGTGHELFLDDYRIAQMSDVDRVVHPGVKDARPLIVADKPWEKTVYYTSVVKPEGKPYQAFYTCYNDVAPNYHTCLAESDDFVNWRKPVVGLVEWGGSTENNIVFAGGGSFTYNPDAPAAPYRMMTFIGGAEFGYHGYSSPDGKRWTKVGTGPQLPGGDVVSVAYDTTTKRYVATYKDRLFTSSTPGTYDRSAFISTSTDFLTWTPRVLAVTGDVADDGYAATYGGVEGQVYGMPVTRYGNTYIGIPWMFSITDFTSGVYKSAADGPVIPNLASSRDLVRWDRSSRGPLITPGVPGSWNDGALYSGNYFRVTGDKVELLYGGFNTWHGGATPEGPSRKVQKASIGRAVWRLDGFVSITNGADGPLGEPGSVTTKPILFDGGTIHVNADVRAGGSLTVEVLDPQTGKAVAGYSAAESAPIRGNRLDATVRWTSGKTLASLAGQQVQLRFNLTNGDLYSYWFTS